MAQVDDAEMQPGEVDAGMANQGVGAAPGEGGAPLSRRQTRNRKDRLLKQLKAQASGTPDTSTTLAEPTSAHSLPPGLPLLSASEQPAPSQHAPKGCLGPSSSGLEVLATVEASQDDDLNSADRTRFKAVMCELEGILDAVEQDRLAACQVAASAVRGVLPATRGAPCGVSVARWPARRRALRLAALGDPEGQELASSSCLHAPGHGALQTGGREHPNAGGPGDHAAAMANTSGSSSSTTTTIITTTTSFSAVSALQCKSGKGRRKQAPHGQRWLPPQVGKGFDAQQARFQEVMASFSSDERQRLIERYASEREEGKVSESDKFIYWLRRGLRGY